MKSPYKEFETSRLYLRKMRLSDASDVFLLRSSDEVNKYITREKQKNISEAEDFINYINNGIENKGWYYWALDFKSHRQFIGTICLWNFSQENSVADIGYELLPAFQGKGLMNEALKTILNFGFNELQLKRIEAYTHRENKSSTKLLLKNNFTFSEYDKENEAVNSIYIAYNPYK